MSGQKRKDDFATGERHDAMVRGIRGQVNDMEVSDPVGSPAAAKEQRTAEFLDIVKDYKLALGGTGKHAKFVMTRDYEIPGDPDRSAMAAEAMSGQLEGLGVKSAYYESSVSIKLADFASGLRRHGVTLDQILPPDQVILFEQELEKQATKPVGRVNKQGGSAAQGAG